MATLAREARKGLETTVKKARKIAEVGARKIIDERLRVGDAKSPGGLSPDEQRLRVRLRAHGRQLGDQRDAKGVQTTGRLVAECAYEHWHRMLFARFLAETELLIEPTSELPISLADCQELAREQGADWLALASTYAVRMLPQIFRPDDPVLEVALPPETRSALEDELKKVPHAVFVADDSLGWVYQFWQADRKEEINDSEVKIGADELPAVTQLFTEDYMVLFLLHNTLGAWWAGKVMASRPELAMTAANEVELRAACAVGDIQWTYLRFDREAEGPWRPAAGTFGGWSQSAREVVVLDPCMGSGHFLVFALPILSAFRMAEEGLSRELAVDAVLRDNLRGLEIDPRCTQIAAFNLALAAWKMTGFHELPQLQLACSGLAPAASEDDWLKLAEQSGLQMTALSREPIRNGLRNLHALFSEAPTLGSLIDPNQLSADLISADYETLKPYLDAALAAEHADDEVHERAVAAAGMVKAAELLANEYTLVATNVPFLGYREMSCKVLDHVASQFPDEKGDLGYCLWRRFHAFVPNGCTTALVTLQHWLSLRSYTAMRNTLLSSFQISIIAHLGARAFETISGEKVNVTLTVASRSSNPMASCISMIDAAYSDSPADKARFLIDGQVRVASQAMQHANPDHLISFGELSELPRFSEYVDCLAGIMNGDSPKFIRCFWELPERSKLWVFLQSTVTSGIHIGGLERIILFD
jgi:hypothetical protein